MRKTINVIFITTKHLRAILDENYMRGVNGEHDYEMYKEEIESELYYRMTRDSQEHNARMMKEYGAREAWLDSQNVPELPINIEEE